MLTLYDFLPSGNGYKVRLLLRALGIPFTLRPIDLLARENRQAWFLAKSPLGQIPALELDDGTVLTESTAILWHFGDGTDWVPESKLARTRVLQWMCFEQTHVDGVISRARFRRRYPDAVPTRPEEFVAWAEQGQRALEVMDQHLAGRDSFVGERLSIADLCLYAYVHCADEGGFTLEPFPAVRAWLERVRARPEHVRIDDSLGAGG